MGRQRLTKAITIIALTCFLVAGAAGQLGRDMVLAAGNAGHDVVGFGRAEMDVTDKDVVRRRLELERPDMVINCTAWTDVDGAETAEEAAFAVNGAGAGNVAAGAREVDAAVVFVSTDYVFDGQKGSPFRFSGWPLRRLYWLAVWRRTAMPSATRSFRMQRTNRCYRVAGANTTPALPRH